MDSRERVSSPLHGPIAEANKHDFSEAVAEELVDCLTKPVSALKIKLLVDQRLTTKRKDNVSYLKIKTLIFAFDIAIIDFFRGLRSVCNVCLTDCSRTFGQRQLVGKSFNINQTLVKTYFYRLRGSSEPFWFDVSLARNSFVPHR